MWNEHGTRDAITRYVRVGTLDEPARCPPQAHIFLRSRQPWVVIPDGQPGFAAYYDAAATWPKESLERYARAKALRASQKTAARGRRSRA